MNHPREHPDQWQFDGACDLTVAVIEAESDMLACVMCDPRRAYPIARRAGIQAVTFTRKDHRLIWLSIEAGRNCRRGVASVFRLATAILRQCGWWGYGASGRWKTGHLLELWGRFPFSPQTIQQNAMRLMLLRRRQIEAERLTGELKAVYAGVRETKLKARKAG